MTILKNNSTKKISPIYAQKSFGFFGLSVDDPIVSDVVNLDTTINGFLVLNNKQITLKANVRYKLEANLQCSGSTTDAYAYFQWYDSTNATYFGKKGYFRSVGAGSGQGNQPCVVGYIIPTVDIQVELRLTASSNFSVVEAESSSAFIESMESIIPVSQTFNTQKDYGFFTLSADQTTGLASGDPIQFDTSEGNINLSSYNIILKPNIRYRLTGMAKIIFTSTSAYCNFAWYNVTNSEYIGNNKGETNPLTLPDNQSIQSTIVQYITPTVETEVQLRITTQSGSSSIKKEPTFAYIESLESHIPVKEVENKQTFYETPILTGDIFDGKPVYKQMFKGSRTLIGGSGSNNITLIESGVDKIVNNGGFLTQQRDLDISLGHTSRTEAYGSLLWRHPTGGSLSIFFDFSASTFEVKSWNVWVEYTKL